MIRLALPFAALVLTGACAQGGRPAPAIPGVQCNAEHLQGLMGQPRSEAVGAEALRLSGAKILRWITPGMMVTMEFRADRLNLHVGPDDKILSARCG